MEGGPRPADGPSLDVLELLRKLQSVGFCLDLDVTLENLGPVFDRILLVFLKEIYQPREARPLPVMLGDGSRVDLFALYWVVRRRGGYDSVSKNGSWATVAEHMGMDPGLGSLLKLIYVKYLDALERWLLMVLEKKVAGDHASCKDAMQKSEGEVSDLLDEVSDHKMNYGESTPGSSSKKVQIVLLVKGNGCKLDNADCIGDDDAMALDNTMVNREFPTLKRKREHLVGMLNWIRRLAKNPGDPFLRKLLVDGGKVKAHAVRVLFSQLLLAREAMFLKKNRCASSNGPFVQKGQKIYPSLYNDYIGSDCQNDEERRCSHRLHSVGKPCHSGSETSMGSNGEADHGPMASTEGINHGNWRLRSSSLLTDFLSGWLYKDRIQKRIPVGPSFQAEVLEWTGVASESSLKWLGTRIWPPQKQESKPLLECDIIGKGRRVVCSCECPSSVDCVRFHVAEERLQVKRELGSAFHYWKFDRMGEEVALSWTEEEELKFKAMVRMNDRVWDHLHLCFPTKRRQELVSYYFNVFLLRRRSFQNRVTPNNIDSDDEESEFGFLSNPYGHDAVKFHNPNSILCAQNKQCMDFEEYGDID